MIGHVYRLSDLLKGGKVQGFCFNAQVDRDYTLGADATTGNAWSSSSGWDVEPIPQFGWWKSTLLLLGIRWQCDTQRPIRRCLQLNRLVA